MASFLRWATARRTEDLEEAAAIEKRANTVDRNDSELQSFSNSSVIHSLARVDGGAPSELCVITRSSAAMCAETLCRAFLAISFAS
eukprot:5172967-Amphidinium_carterae.1